MEPKRLEDTQFWVIARRSNATGAREFPFGWHQLRWVAIEIAHAALSLGMRGVYVIDRLADPLSPHGWQTWPTDGTKRDR